MLIDDVSRTEIFNGRHIVRRSSSYCLTPNLLYNPESTNRVTSNKLQTVFSVTLLMLRINLFFSFF